MSDDSASPANPDEVRAGLDTLARLFRAKAMLRESQLAILQRAADAELAELPPELAAAYELAQLKIAEIETAISLLFKALGISEPPQPSHH